MDDVFAQESAKIDAARKRYFALWPNGPGIDQAEETSCGLFGEKDTYYLALSTSTAMNTVFWSRRATRSRFWAAILL